MRRTTWLLAAVTLALCVLPASTFRAQTPQQPIRVGTNFVRVDAYPTLNGTIVADLGQDDFELLEDGVPQRIETFEHVVPGHGPQSARVDPSSQREMLNAVANARHRVFVIFLDAPNVTRDASRDINEPLIRFLKTQVGDDDLVALMTPEMSTANVVFGRKTQVIEEALRARWDWGRFGRFEPELDERDVQYQMCYPSASSREVASRMIQRRRERVTLDALHDLVKFLASVREERKAIITVTQGWVLFRPDPELMRQGTNETPMGIDKVVPGTGSTLGETKVFSSTKAIPKSECDADRMQLAQMNDEQYLRDLIDEANRGNASFYMIDPRGLTMAPADRSGALRTLAENTDGVVAINSNDLDKGLARMAADMSSYYLIGYYPTNTKTDGKFRSITVRVKKPGVVVRARRGYRAPTREETLTASAAAVTAPAPTMAATSGGGEVSSTIDKLARLRPDARLRIQVVPMAVAGAGLKPRVWVAGELQSNGGKPDEFELGGKARVEAVTKEGSATATVTLKPGERTFLTTLDLPAATAGAFDVFVHVAAEEGRVPPLSDGVRLDLAAPTTAALLFRRGVTTGNRLLPAADVRFSRTERLHLEIPVGPAPRDGKPGAGRVLDRVGQPLQVPVVVSERTDETTGQRWIVADVSLAPMSPGDYAIDVGIDTGGEPRRVLTGIRVVR